MNCRHASCYYILCFKQKRTSIYGATTICQDFVRYLLSSASPHTTTCCVHDILPDLVALVRPRTAIYDPAESLPGP